MHPRCCRATRIAVPLSVATLVAGLLLCSAARPAAGDWAEGFHSPGPSDAVNALTVFDDGSGSALYAGGYFRWAGQTEVNFVAKWNGTSWSALGTGLGWTYAFAEYDDGSGPALYAGGSFFGTDDHVTEPSIAKWDGSSWVVPGEGIFGWVYALAVFDDGSGPALFVGGSFSEAGGVNAQGIAKWNGASWFALGDGTSNAVHSMAVFDDGTGPALYVGGSFTTAGGVLASKIAKWDGTAWSPLGAGVGEFYFDSVRALAVFDDGSGPALYAAGLFTTAGGASVNHIAKWDGNVWSSVGGGFSASINQSPPIRKLVVLDDGSGAALFAGGDFSTAGGVSANNVAKWDGSVWSPLADGIGGGYSHVVNALVAFDGGSGPALVAGGDFDAAGSNATGPVARWNGASWSSLTTGSGAGLAEPVRFLGVFDAPGQAGERLIAGGYFRAAGSSVAAHVAEWDGTSWSPLGGGTDGYVDAVVEFDDGSGPALYVGGDFNIAGGVSANNIARWNGASWSSLGGVTGGPYDRIHALTVFDDGLGPALYVGGNFTTAGSVSANYIAKWDGSNWSPLGNGVNYWVQALAVFDDGSGPALYVGGGFSSAGDVSADGLAKWNGASWTSLGDSPDTGLYVVYALAVFDDSSGPALYIGGESEFGPHLSKWDGTSWSLVGRSLQRRTEARGCCFAVYSLAVFDDGSGPALYAGTNSGWNGYIKKWDGVSWSALGSGTDGYVSALAVFDDGCGPALWAGGGFETAGGIASSRIARWSTAVLPPCSAPPSPYGGRKNRYISFTPNNLGEAVAFRVRTIQSSYFPASVGLDRWVDTPDVDGIAQLVEAPVTRVWPEPAIHVGDCEVVPAAAYEVRATTDGGTTFSAPLTVRTITQPSPKFWGDTVGAFGNVVAGQWDPPNGVVNVNDYVAALQKFLGVSTAPHVSVVDVQSVSSTDPCLNRVTNIADVFLIIKAFQGDAYPFTTYPANCPPCP